MTARAIITIVTGGSWFSVGVEFLGTLGGCTFCTNASWARQFLSAKIIFQNGIVFVCVCWVDRKKVHIVGLERTYYKYHLRMLSTVQS